MSNIEPVPVKLSKLQAIRATQRPLKRIGDLVHVQVDARFGSLYAGMKDLAGQEMPTGQMRSIFAPSTDFNVKVFSQPITQEHIETLYAEDGWLESLVLFSDVALALYFEYKAGKIRPSGLAYDVGDPSRFETDLAENPESKKGIIALHKKDLLPAQEGRKASQTARLKAQKPRGALDDGQNEGQTIQDIIKRLVRNNPGYQPKDLWWQFVGEMNNIGGKLSEDEKTLTYDYKDVKKTISCKHFSDSVRRMKTP